MSLANAKKSAAVMVQSALDIRIEELKQTDEFKELQKQIQDFEENGNPDNLRIDSDGCLVSSMRIYLDRTLCTDEDGNADSELAEAMLKECSDILWFEQDDYSQGYFEWTANVSHGDAIVFNESPERNCYAIYSEAHNLKIDKSDLIDEEHGYLLIEQAMRRDGYFPGIVSTDSCGFAFYRDSGMGRLTDEEIETRLAAKLAAQDSDAE